MKQSPKTSHTLFALLLASLAAFLLSAGCGEGSGQGLDADGNLLTGPGGGGSGGGGGGASGNPDATLAWLQTNVFGCVCSQCHTGAGAPLGVNWSSETNSCANVGRISVELPGLVEIESGNTAGSYVIWKVEGAGPNGETIVGEQMPAQNPPLAAATIQNMRDWIADGALGC
jgi:hypothetical protein